MPPWVLLIQALVSGAAQLLESQKNKTAQEIGVDAQLADQIALAVLQKTAEVKGAAVDWNDPTAIALYVQSLPVYVPIGDTGSTSPAPAADPAPGTSI